MLLAKASPRQSGERSSLWRSSPRCCSSLFYRGRSRWVRDKNCCSRVNLLRKQLFIYKLGVNSSPLLGLLLWYLGATGSRWPPAFTAAVTGSWLVLQCSDRLKPPTGAFQDGSVRYQTSTVHRWHNLFACHSHKIFLPLLHAWSLFVTSYIAGNSNILWGKIYNKLNKVSGQKKNKIK